MLVGSGVEGGLNFRLDLTLTSQIVLQAELGLTAGYQAGGCPGMCYVLLLQQALAVNGHSWLPSQQRYSRRWGDVHSWHAGLMQV